MTYKNSSKSRDKHVLSKQTKKVYVSSIKSKVKIGLAGLVLAASINYGIMSDQDFSDPIRELKRIEYPRPGAESDSEALKEARKDSSPRVRQQFLDDLLRDVSIPYCSEVVYDPDGVKSYDYLREVVGAEEPDRRIVDLVAKKSLERVRKKRFQVYTLGLMTESKRNPIPKMFVSGYLFKDHLYNDVNIKHIFKYHEGRHCEQYFKGLEALGYIDDSALFDGLMDGAIKEDVKIIIEEGDAKNIEFKAIMSGESKVTLDLFKNIISKRIGYYKSLKEIEKHSSPIQKKFIENALKKLY